MRSQRGLTLVLLVLASCAACAVGVADAAISPTSLRAAILEAAAAKHSVHYVTVSSEPRGRMTMVADVAADRGVQRATLSEGGRTGHATMLVVDSTAYIRGDTFALRAYFRFPVSFATRHAGQWLSIPHTSPLYAPAAIDVTFGSFVHDAMPQGSLSLVSGMVAGKRLRGLRGTAPEGGTLTLYVPTGGTPLPVEGREVVRSAHVTSRVTMSRWNESVRVQAPAQATPLPGA